MGWTIYYFLERKDTPLTEGERGILDKHADKWKKHAWEHEPYWLDVADEPRTDGLLAYGMVKPPRDAGEVHDDVTVLLEALTELRGLASGARLWVSDDYDLAGWDPESCEYVLDPDLCQDDAPDFVGLDGFRPAGASSDDDGDESSGDEAVGFFDDLEWTPSTESDAEADADADADADANASDAEDSAAPVSIFDGPPGKRFAPTQLVEALAGDLLRLREGFEVSFDTADWCEKARLRGHVEAVTSLPLDDCRGTAIARDSAGRVIDTDDSYLEPSTGQLDWEIDVPSECLAIADTVEIRIDAKAILDFEIARLETGRIRAGASRAMIGGELSLPVVCGVEAELSASVTSDHQLYVVGEVNRRFSGRKEDRADIVVSLYDESGGKMSREVIGVRLAAGHPDFFRARFDLDDEILARVRTITATLKGEFESSLTVGRFPLRHA